MRRICVFCGSKSGAAPAYAEAAAELGRALVRRGLGLVYGGGHVGLMGVVADAVLEAGGEVIGVIPRSLVDLELAHRGVTELREVETMHERKQLMHDLADGYVALPGSLGTYEELFEALAWRQLGYHDRHVAILDVNDYFGPLLEVVDRAVAEGFLDPEHRRMVRRFQEVDAALEWLAEAWD